MPYLGAHMSVAGGLPRAVARAVVHGCEALQIFAKNASQWRGRPLPADEIAAFRTAVHEAGLRAVVSHASYLINLATTDALLRDRSREAMADELDRAEALGLLGVVLHPGCYTSGSAATGLKQVAGSLRDLLDERRSGQTLVLLECTAGQGSSLGANFEELAEIIHHMDGDPRVAVCLDTCHLLAAGYDIVSEDGYARTFSAFGRTVGFARLKAFHLNDSKKPLGSRVDRHDHIGQGHLGLEPFRRLVNDPRFAALPMLLETPKAEGKATGPITVDPLDARNLDTLRGMMSPGGTGKPGGPGTGRPAHARPRRRDAGVRDEPA
ncbi:MAG: deoxyribonuclease IV [Vicinamibacterales bacterium]